MKPGLVAFDLDDTLFAHRAAVATGIGTWMDATGIVPPDRARAQALWHELEEHHYHRYLAGELDFEGQRRARATDFAAEHGVSIIGTEAGAWFDAYFEHYRAAWVLHDDALDTIASLRSSHPAIRIAIITNGDPVFQQAKLDAVGLSPLIDGVVASGAIGITKPDPRIFTHACRLYGVDPAEAVYVGDRLRTDAIGAAAAGLTGVWLDRPGIGWHGAEAAEAIELGVVRISTLSELGSTLESL